MQEIFKDIKGHEGLYQISDLGRVKSLSRKWSPNVSILKTTISDYGYRRIGISNRNRKSIIYSLHRLIAIAFIPNPENKKTINHKDGNKLNNNISNLEWATYSENIKHAHAIGLSKSPKYWKNKYGKDHNKSKKVYQYDNKENLINIFDGVNDASRILNIPSSCITMCATGRYKTGYGYIWKYSPIK